MDEVQFISLAPHPDLYNRAFAWLGVEGVEAFEKNEGVVAVRWTGDEAVDQAQQEQMLNALVNGAITAYLRETAGRGPSHEQIMATNARSDW